MREGARFPYGDWEFQAFGGSVPGWWEYGRRVVWDTALWVTLVGAFDFVMHTQ